MKREEITLVAEQKPTVEIPLNPSLVDISGNGNDATLESGSISTVYINGETWGNLQSAIVNLKNPQQLSYINSFRLEVDLYAISFSSPSSNWMAVDGFDDGSIYKGVKIGCSWGSLFAAGVGASRTPSNDWTYGLYIDRNQVPLQTPLNVTIENTNNAITVILTNLSTNTEIARNIESTPTFTNVSRTFLGIGRDARYGTGRRFNGYMRNFKLWSLEG